jgi:hypothetical protein
MAAGNEIQAKVFILFCYPRGYNGSHCAPQHDVKALFVFLQSRYLKLKKHTFSMFSLNIDVSFSAD